MPNLIRLRLLAAPALFALLLLVAAPTLAQEQLILDHGEPVPGYGAPWPEFVPGTMYDDGIPTLEEVAGHAIRDEITAPDEIVAYLEALAAAAPARTRFLEYGRSWEGRPLVALFVGSPENIGRLDAVGAGLRTLADPRGVPGAEIESLIADLPVMVSLVHGIHGNEISSAGAAMALAHHLLAATNDPDVDRILENAVVMIDPAQNPDGRARFVLGTRQARGLFPDPDPASAEHDEPWPGGRVNHYLFDLNRDWFAQTQPESRARIELLLEYPAQVVADIHEMGGNSSYYFPPNAVPSNPRATDAQKATVDRLGRAMAAAFDERGFLFFNRDTYDNFYPGYGSSWPTLQGSIGMTFEQASARGLVFRRDDGSVLTYGEGILQHFTAALATVRLAAEEREVMLRGFVDYRRSAVAEGGDRAYVLHSEHDPEMARRLATTLANNGVDVFLPNPDSPPVVDGRTLDGHGTFIVPLGQPEHRLIRNLLDQNTPMNPDFVQRQIELRAQRERDEIYDVTAWSMPVLWDVERHEMSGVATGTSWSEMVESDIPDPQDVFLDELAVAWLMPWGTGTAEATARLLREGFVVRTTGAPMTIAGRDWPVGTAIVRVAENRDAGNLQAWIDRVRNDQGVEAVQVASSYTDTGTSFGSNDTRRLRLPRVALAWETGYYSTGWARYVLEQRYGIPVTAIRADNLGQLDADDYDVLVLASNAIPQSLADDLRDFMADGGTVVTMGESSRSAARIGLLSTSTELKGGAPEFGEGAGNANRPVPDQPIDPIESLAPPTELPAPVPGAILNVVLDTGHWLAAGTDGRIGSVVEGNRVFTPMTLDAGRNVGRYAGLDDLIASGIVWEDARPQLAHKAYLMHQSFGAGQLIAFAEDPNYRSYSEATQLLFLNAVLIGPGR